MKNKKVYQVGDVFTAELLKSDKGAMPICRTEEGMVCFIERQKGAFYPYNSLWELQVVEVQERKLIVKPTVCIASPEEMKVRLQSKLSELSEYFHIPKINHSKVKRGVNVESYVPLSQRGNTDV